MVSLREALEAKKVEYEVKAERALDQNKMHTHHHFGAKYHFIRSLIVKADRR